MPGSPPIGIRSIDIRNFRGIESLRLEFVGPGDGVSDVAVLAGPNGCGKTTVLEACLLALGYDGELRGKRAGRHGKPDYWSITAEVDVEGSTVNYLVDRFTGPTAPAEPCLYFSSWRAPSLVGSLPVTAGKAGRPPKDSESNRLWNIKQRLINLKARESMRGRPLPDMPRGFAFEIDRLSGVWNSFYPGSRAEFTVEPVGGDADDGFDLFLSDPQRGTIPVDELSSGQLELLCLFGGLMLAKFDRGVVVIDEPELHLDPQWHAVMLLAIRRFLPEAQLIVATHSPRVFDAVYSFQRHFLVPETDPRAAAWRADPTPAEPALA